VVNKNPSSNSADLLALLEQGIQHHQSGNLVVAAVVYEQVLDLFPGQPDALHLLGVVRHQSGDHPAAIDLIQRSIKKNPKNADAHSNLGAALTAIDELDAAAKSFKRAVKLKPDYVDAHANLAAIHVRRGEDSDAIHSFRKASRHSPGEPRFMKRLAELYLKLDQFAEATDWFERYLSIAPDDAEAHNNAAFAYDSMYNIENAEAHYCRAAELDPEKPEIANNWASVLQRLGQADKAEQVYERALNTPLEAWENPSNFAGALFNSGQLEESLALYEKLVLERPEEGDLLRDFGMALVQVGRIQEAEKAFRRAHELCPEQGAVCIAFAHSLLRIKKNDEAIDVLKSVGAKSPHYLAACLDLCLIYAASDQLEEGYKIAKKAAAHRDYKSTMYVKLHSIFRTACAFDDLEKLHWRVEEVEDRDLSAWAGLFVELLATTGTPEEVSDLASLHRRWGEGAEKAASTNVFTHSSEKTRSGPIRLGFVSSDLKKHSVARFVLPLFNNYDRDRFEIYCYSPDEDAEDEIQQQIRGLIKEFRVLDNMSYFQVAEQIRNDDIDILFELNGYTADSRLNVMAYRPAPVQIYWLGYPGTTGMKAMDYFLLDEFTVPENLDWLTEKPLVIPGSWVCYDAFEQIAIPSEPPVTRNGVITFGTLNAPYKFTRAGIALWSDVMKKVPNSRFLSVHPEHKAPLLAANLIREFKKNGIESDRLSFVNNRNTSLSHFSFYEEIDISLDTLPLTGGTTTVDALWCGVPIITLVGPALHQRLSYSLLKGVGADELCTHTPDEFVVTAVKLAGDVDALRGYRQSLRAAFRKAPLGNSSLYTENFQNLMLEIADRHKLR
jgi:predicted O-linked N-acetylglucosamine transferase (SPINDLY family)